MDCGCTACPGRSEPYAIMHTPAGLTRGGTSLGVHASGRSQPSTSGAGIASGLHSEPGRPSAPPPAASSAGSAVRLKPPAAGAHSSGSVRSPLGKHCGSASAAVRFAQPRSNSPLRAQRGTHQGTHDLPIAVCCAEGVQTRACPQHVSCQVDMLKKCSKET